VLVAAGALNDLARDLNVSIAAAGQLVTAGAVTMAIGAPLLAWLLGGIDRRRLLVASLLWLAAWHALAVLFGDLPWLLVLRATAVLAAAVFTPQAAAAIGVMVPPKERGMAIATVFLGWSLASVLAMPAHNLIGEILGWRWAYGLVVLLALAAGAAVWRTMPDGVRPPPMDLRAWRAVFTNPLLMGIVAITALSGAGQFTLFTFQAPYFTQVIGTGTLGLSLLFLWFGAFGVIGNLLLSRVVDHLGAARCATVALVLMMLTMVLWPLGTQVPAAWGTTVMTAVLVPWALGCFSANSAQQARLAAAAPGQAPALMALNTSAIYIGQGLGAAGGGAMVAAAGLTALWPVALAWLG
jgi:predicted MFS family arabinose efflux permease